jgi:dipeptidyl-peptidase 4
LDSLLNGNNYFRQNKTKTIHPHQWNKPINLSPQSQMKLKILSGIFLLISFILSAQQQKKELTLQEIWASRTFAPEMVYGINSMESGEFYTSLDQVEGGQEINQYSYKTGKLVNNILKTKDLIIPGKTEPLSIDEYMFNAEENKILLATESEPIYRHSSKAHWYVYDMKTKKLVALSEGGKQMFATFSPVHNRVAFVRDNNIFFKDFENNSETQVTFDGKQNEIINGATDWVYEEEFSFDRAYFWSPDGNKIAFYRFDESEVKEFSMTMYGSLYPEEYRYKYPKAGEKNSDVGIFIYTLYSTVPRMAYGIDGNKEYIPRVQWANSDVLSIQKLNRHQNQMDIFHCNLATTKPMEGIQAQLVYSETSSTYIDGSDDRVFYIRDGKQFIWLSDKDGFSHIYLYDLDKKEMKPITKGNWDLTNYLGFDEKTSKIYFVSAESSPMQRDLYSINLNGSGKTKLTTKAGFNKPTFSKGYRYFINEHSTANTPAYISLHSNDGKEIRVLKDNSRLRNTLATYQTSPKEFFNFTTSQNVQLNGWMIKPTNFDPNKKYPVFMFVYGGPGSQTVKDAWEGANYLYYQFLAQKGFLVVSVDNRGTGARGAEFKKVTYMQLGKYETEDQIEAAKYLGSLDYVDAQRIGIMGWSYGGYMSSLCITKGADIFKAAIAVAPVTNWRFYDSIYTERYMRTPQENASGYDDNSPINHVNKLRGNYLIIHGTADDNVHFQNMVEMVTSLNKANKQYDMMFYPNKNHGIYGGNTRLHLYTRMTEFLIQNL